MKNEKNSIRGSRPLHLHVILGLDPGIALSGYAVLRARQSGRVTLLDCGVIRTPQTASQAERLLLIYRQIEALILRHAPDEAAVERLFLGGANVTSALRVGEARGVILLGLANHHVPIHDYWPSSVKLVVTGKGNATKLQVGECVRKQFRLASVPKPDDAADAAAVALCHWLSLRRAQAVVETQSPPQEQRAVHRKAAKPRRASRREKDSPNGKNTAGT